MNSTSANRKKNTKCAKAFRYLLPILQYFPFTVLAKRLAENSISDITYGLQMSKSFTSNTKAKFYGKKLATVKV